MKAEVGKRYAQVTNGICRWKFDITTLPEWADDAFLAVDITTLSPEPDEGDLFDGVAFSKPPVRQPTAEEVAEAQRRQAIEDDVLRQQLVTQLRTATNTQISDFVDNQVTDLASARLMLKRIILVLALVVTR